VTPQRRVAGDSEAAAFGIGGSRLADFGKPIAEATHNRRWSGRPAAGEADETYLSDKKPLPTHPQKV
jgi:hypothetical protein